MMEELYFGVPRVGTKVVGPSGRKLTVRKNKAGRRYIEYTSKRTGEKTRKFLEPKSSPMRKRKSPKRVKKMCSKTMSLAKLRKLANEHGVSVLSMAKRRMNKRTGELVKPKLIGCSALKKRLKDAGLEHLYKSVKIVDDKSDVSDEPQSLFEDSGDESDMESEDEPLLQYPGVHEIDAHVRRQAAKEAKSRTFGNIPLSQQKPSESDDDGPVLEENVPKHGFVQDLFGLDFGKRMKVKPVARISVKGRVKNLYRGAKGGMYYKKGNNKVYITAESAKKRRSPLRKRK
jgi:hypothetical protein